ncbi:MAG: tetratricopeptide repeat protein [Xanthomonadales bacterium]|nr:tetratricopeptide repeat protein [Xanthomonadales bacterium]
MDIQSLEKLLGTARDSAMLRLTLARLLAAQRRLNEAEQHLAAAVDMDAGYTAAWKELGKVRQSQGKPEAARSAWRAGIEAAQANGDKQAEREMGVFLKRLDKKSAGRGSQRQDPHQA